MGTRVAFKTANQAFPSQGNRELPVVLDFTSTALIADTLFQEMSASQIEMVQSVYIDNSKNAAPLTLIFQDTLQNITAPPFSQGIYPVISAGKINYTAATVQGIKLQIIFSNTEKNYAVWFVQQDEIPALGLINEGITPVALAVGDNVLVAAVAAESVKLYRGMFEVDGNTILKWTDGAGGAVLFSASLSALGSSNFPIADTPWMQTSKGNALILNSSAVANLYGGFGYVQS
jgi:hypothetical protein